MSIRYINYTDSPFLEAHDICIDSNYHWNLFLGNQSFNLHYPSYHSIRCSFVMSRLPMVS